MILISSNLNDQAICSRVLLNPNFDPGSSFISWPQQCGRRAVSSEYQLLLRSGRYLWNEHRKLPIPQRTESEICNDHSCLFGSGFNSFVQNRNEMVSRALRTDISTKSG
jgi:hypothetical protein